MNGWVANEWWVASRQCSISQNMNHLRSESHTVGLQHSHASAPLQFCKPAFFESWPLLPLSHCAHFVARLPNTRATGRKAAHDGVTRATFWKDHCVLIVFYFPCIQKLLPSYWTVTQTFILKSIIFLLILDNSIILGWPQRFSLNFQADLALILRCSANYVGSNGLRKWI